MRSFRKFGVGTAACYIAVGMLAASPFAQGQETTGQVSPPPGVSQAGVAQDQSAPSGGWRKVGGPPTVAEETNPADGQPGEPPEPPSEQDLGNGVHVYEPAPQGAPPPVNVSAPPSQLTIPPGTYITVRVNQRLSSNENRVGDPFTATLQQPVVVNGIVVASPGETVSGQVTEAVKSGRIEGVARLGVQLTELPLVDGQQIPIQSQFVSQVAQGSQGRDAGAIAGTTALGAVIGAAAGWGTGAAIGAGAGAAAGTIGVLLTRGHASVIGPEEVLTFRILQPVTISTINAPQAFRAVDPREYGYYAQQTQQSTVQYQQSATPPPVPYYGYPVPYASSYPYPFYGFGYPYEGFGYPYGGGVGVNLFLGPGWYGGHYYPHGGYGPRNYGSYGGYHGYTGYRGGVAGRSYGGRR